MVRHLVMPLWAALLAGVGCASLQQVRQPTKFIPDAKPRVVYVTFRNHSKVTITQPRVRGDTLFGTVRGAARPVAAPLSHIERVEAMQRDRKRTRWLIAGLGLVTAAGVFALTHSGTSGYRHPCDLSGTEECDYSQARLRD